jgi:glutathione synthase/RimK-type ligase-like ATP-grasp enzyme
MSEPNANIRCLKTACERLGIPYFLLDENGNFLSLNVGGRNFYFANYATPFNTDSVSRICKDKDFSYRLLKTKVAMPDTLAFLDPNSDEKYKGYRKFRTIDEITAEIMKVFGWPVIVKMNSGSRGRNVFLCRAEAEVRAALIEIYDKNSRYYDYVALAEEYLEPAAEFRAVVFRKNVMLCYQTESRFPAGASGGWPDSKKSAESEILNFVAPVFGVLDLEFGAFDIIQSYDNRLHLIEVNTMPGFDRYVERNGVAPVVEMYCRILKSI